VEEMTGHLSIVDKLNNVIEFLNETGVELNTLNEAVTYLQNEGLDISVLDNVNKKINDGTLSTLINQTILGDINTQISDLVINVKKMGAKGDGVSDDVVALKNVFNLARDNGSVKIYFPKGTYCISDYINLYKNTSVEMHPQAVIKRIGTGYKMFMNGVYHDNSTTAYNGNGNIHFYGGTIDLNQSTLPPTQTLSCFDLGHGENISFTKLKIKNGQIGHYFQVSSCKNVRFKDCWFGDVVYSDTSSANYELIQIEEATATSFPTFGGYDMTPSRDIYIEDCIFENVIRAIGTHSTTYNVYAENINITGCVFKNSFDSPLCLFQYKNVTVKDNYINGCQYGINTNMLMDSVITGNTVLNAQKSGINMNGSNGNKISKNVLKETCLSTLATYSAIRVATSNDNTFDDDTVYSVVPNYSNAWFSSGGCTGNRIISHKYTTGKTNRINGADSTEIMAYQLGSGQDVLFDGDIASITTPVTLPHDIRNYNFIIVMANNNGGSASMVSTIIPKQAILLGTTIRYRIVTGDSSSSVQIDFSFPTQTSIQADSILGGGHIRKVIGVL
jgi:DNA-binding transcriptional regulator YhcF (GntR family)